MYWNNRKEANQGIKEPNKHDRYLSEALNSGPRWELPQANIQAKVEQRIQIVSSERSTALSHQAETNPGFNDTYILLNN